MSLMNLRDKSKSMLFREPEYRLESVVTAVPLPSHVEYNGRAYSTHMSKPILFGVSGSMEYHYDLKPVHDATYEMDASV